MFRGFFNRMYYGKGDKPDLTPEDMAQNKFQLFFEVLGVQWWSMVKLNLIVVLFALPVILWTGFNLQGITGVLTEAGEAVTSETVGKVTSLLFYYIIGLIPCLIILAPGLAAMAGVCRKWARDDHVWLIADFRDYLKANWKQSMGLMALNGLLLILFVWSYWLYGEVLTASPQLFMMAMRMLMIVIAIFYTLSTLYMMPMLVTYKLRIRDIIRNSILLAIARLHFTVFFNLLVLLPLILLGLLSIFWQYGTLILLGYYLVFGVAFGGYIAASYTNATFDRFFREPGEQSGSAGRRGAQTVEALDPEERI
ncbi:MAG: DUF624 domain-containing protein [Clostridiales bacterium]|nr:DUF624 domain-containing protein [Clostridiales bacterium]